jgi:hypothetical protein
MKRRQGGLLWQAAAHRFRYALAMRRGSAAVVRPLAWRVRPAIFATGAIRGYLPYQLVQEANMPRHGVSNERPRTSMSFGGSRGFSGELVLLMR